MAEAYSEYLVRLRDGLKSLRSSTSSEVIFGEAKAHLDEGIEVMVGQGMTRSDAEAETTRLFGDAGAACAWYGEFHRRPTVWRAARWPLAYLLLIALLRESRVLSYVEFSLPLPWIIKQFVPAAVEFGLVIPLVIVCYRSKRFTSGVIALATAVGFVLTVFGMYLFGVTCPGEPRTGVSSRSTAEESIRNAPAELAKANALLQTLRTGHGAFASKTPPQDLPSLYLDPRGYRTPIYFLNLDGRSTSYVDGVPSTGVFADYKEARNFWENQPKGKGTQVPFDVANVLARIDYLQRVESDQPGLLARPRIDNLSDELSLTSWITRAYLIFGIFADVCGGVLRLLGSMFGRWKSRVRTHTALGS